MTDNQYGLPWTLKDGLLLRWGKPEDAEELSQFNVRIHSDNPAEPETFLAHWTHDLMNGEHPTTKADDFTIIVDQRTGEIVSCANLISQTWRFEDIEFNVGRPELVGTDPAYRRRGLIKAQMEAIHAKSEARGELVQAITGIPWYYRQFDYDMALDLGGSRHYFWQRQGKYKPVTKEIFLLRPATEADIPVLKELYSAHCGRSLINRVRDDLLWRYELSGPHQESSYARNMQIIETTAKKPVAYAEYRQWGNEFSVREFGVLPGYSWRAVGLFLTRALKVQADVINRDRKEPVDHINFKLGHDHPIYEALGRQLTRQIPAYAWYIRVPDLPRFLWHIAPVLEKRLAASVLAGHTGTSRLNFYRKQLTLVFEGGQLKALGAYKPKNTYDGDALFPDLTFLQLAFGYRSLAELVQARADCDASDVETAVLLNILFPKQHSCVIPLG